jgi:hypothetical protein
MDDESPSSPGPQFNTAEFADKPAPNICEFCGQAISDSYYRVNSALSCPACAEKAKFEVPAPSGQSFARALLFGAGAAVAGLILYATFAIVTGWIIGYVSLAVGYIVGKAVMKGSGGIGGRRYQIAAAALTYAAVSMAAIPVVISQFIDQKAKPPAQVEQSQNKEPGAPAASPNDAAAPQQNQPAGEPEMGFGAALGLLVLIGLASPFLALADPFSGLIGLVILFVGIQIAWKLTAGTTTDILGPFRVASAFDQTTAG